jgi:hypothetical protein
MLHHNKNARKSTLQLSVSQISFRRFSFELLARPKLALSRSCPAGAGIGAGDRSRAKSSAPGRHAAPPAPSLVKAR